MRVANHDHCRLPNLLDEHLAGKPPGYPAPKGSLQLLSAGEGSTQPLLCVTPQVVLDVVFNHTGEGAWGVSNWNCLAKVAVSHWDGRHPQCWWVTTRGPGWLDWLVDWLVDSLVNGW